jgi:hypothetical protein
MVSRGEKWKKVVKFEKATRKITELGTDARQLTARWTKETYNDGTTHGVEL